MSRQGFIFSELGFMTTDFEQLQRGHTQWVNHVIHHPLQNGIYELVCVELHRICTNYPDVL